MMVRIAGEIFAGTRDEVIDALLSRARSVEDVALQMRREAGRIARSGNGSEAQNGGRATNGGGSVR